jgi:hypothetical protein
MDQSSRYHPQASRPALRLVSPHRAGVIHTMSFVLAGRHYGTIAVDATFDESKPLRLYVLAEDGAPGYGVDCLVTDEPLDDDAARGGR